MMWETEAHMDPNVMGDERSASNVFLQNDHHQEHALLQMADAEIWSIEGRAKAAESRSAMLQQNQTGFSRRHERQLAEAQTRRLG